MNYDLKEYHVDDDLKDVIKHIQAVINQLNSRRDKGLSESMRKKLFNHLKLSQVYNSNAIEGSQLSLRETELILESMVLLGGSYHEEEQIQRRADCQDPQRG